MIKSKAKELNKDIIIAEKTANIPYNITVKNHVEEIFLKTKEVEFEKNINARYAKNEKLNHASYNYNILYDKGNNNETRMQNLITNANKLSTLNHQYIVFDRNLVLEIREWLESIPARKYGDMSEDIQEIKKMFPIIDKEWLAIDGNSYFSIIKQIYLEKKKMKNHTGYHDAINSPLCYWSKYYQAKRSKGYAYTISCLNSEPYYRDIQIIELISLILEKNLQTWDAGNIDIFYKRLSRLLFYVVEKNTKKETLYKTFTRYQALKYLFLPNISTSGKCQRFTRSKRMDYYTFTALFGEQEDLNNTTYNIRLFTDVINYVLSKKLERIQYNTGKDILNLVHMMMYRYQEESKKIVPDGFNSRDRLTKATSFCSCDDMFAKDLKETIENEDLSEIKNASLELVEWMCNKYSNYIKNITVNLFGPTNIERDKYEKMYRDIISGVISQEEFIRLNIMKDWSTKNGI
ncbi:MAG: hypothetical protein ACLU9Y_09115 [Thomasclavelia ramosa]